MVQRLWVLVTAEFLVLVLLATQVFGGNAGSPAGTGPNEPAPRAATPAAAEALAASLAAHESAPAAAPPRAAEREAVTERHDPADPAGILLHGTVRFADGSAVAKARLYLRDDAGGRSVECAANGDYACPGLRPGAWRITANADGVVRKEVEHVLGDDAVQRFDLVVDPTWPVRVRIEAPDGGDANAIGDRQLGLPFGFHVVGSKAPIPEDLAPTDYSVVFHGDAHWERIDRPKDGIAGTLHLAAPPPAYAAVMLRHVVLAQQRLEAGQKEATFIVDPAATAARFGKVRLRLLDDATSVPIAGVRCTGRSSSGGGAHAVTGADGVATLAGVLPGIVILELQGEKENEPVTTRVRVAPGETRDLGDLRLGRLVELRGRLVDADGKPAQGHVQWTSLRWRTEPREFVDHRSAQVDADGTFTLRVGPGLHAITATDREGRIATGVFEHPAAAPIELRLRPATRVIVTRPLDPAQSFTVTVLDDRRRPVAGWTLENRAERWPKSLPPGDYAYEVHDVADRLVQSGELRVGSEPVELAIRGGRP